MDVVFLVITLQVAAGQIDVAISKIKVFVNRN
jgi:hypothetical protein